MNALRKLLANPYALRHVAYSRFRKHAEGYTREPYFHCISEAARTADALGVPRILIIEFGVAGGNGLLEIERICAALQRRRGVAFEIYGFDTGTGLPPPLDWRDFPFQWREGFFAMDVEKLRRRLKAAQLVLGDVKETVAPFAARTDRAPIGAVMFDLDYYSSTVHALGIFDDARPEGYLPRIPCYFDDIEGISSAGVSLAIREFNDAHAMKKLENPLKLRHGRDFRDWGWKVYELHDFAHPQYATPIVRNSQLPLK